MKTTNSQKNRLRFPILALLFCAIGFVIGYGFYHMSQSKYVVLNKNHPGAVSLMNTFYWMERNLDTSNERLKIDNERITNIIANNGEYDPIKFQKYVDSSLRVKTYGDSIILELKNVLKILRQRYSREANKDGLVSFKDPFLNVSNLQDYFVEITGNSMQELIDIWNEDFFNFLPPDDQIRYPFSFIDIGYNLRNGYQLIEGKTNLEFNLNNLPLQSISTIIALWENEIRLTQNNILYYFLVRTGSSSTPFEIHKVTSYPKNQQIYKGETYITDIYLLPNRPLYENMTILVDGNEIPFKNGPGKFSKKASNAGTYSYKVEIVLQSPRTLEKFTYSDIFEYTVIQREPTLQMQRPEVLYTGVDNLISIEVPDALDFEFQLKGHGAGIDIAPAGEEHPTQYVVSVSESGPASITVSGKYLKTTTFDFFAKQVPMPQISLAGKTGGEIAIEDFKAVEGILIEAIDFPLDIDMEIKEFELVRISKREMEERIINDGAVFMDEAFQLIQKAQSGDWYVFRNIQLDAYWDDEETGYKDMVFYVK